MNNVRHMICNFTYKKKCIRFGGMTDVTHDDLVFYVGVNVHHHVRSSDGLSPPKAKIIYFFRYVCVRVCVGE